MAPLTLGKSILSLIAIITCTGPYIADWNETHVLNPKWPPHARFHNGQTMSTGLLLGLSTLFYLYRPIADHSSTSSSLKQTYLNFSLLLIHIYYLPSLSGMLYPGALCTDPEFGEGCPQLWAFSVFLGIAWVGWFIERRELSKEMGEKMD